MIVCINMEDIIHSEISQTDKEKYCMVSLRCRIWKKIKLLEAEDGMVVTRKWDSEDGEMGVKDTKLKLCRDFTSRHNNYT